MIKFKILDRVTQNVMASGEADSLRNVQDADGYSPDKHVIIYRLLDSEDDTPETDEKYWIYPQHH